MPLYDCPHCRNKFGADYEDESILHCPHCNGTVAIPDEENIVNGDIIGGFEIVRLLGKGGMGRVYLAKQLSMNRLVALKVLPKFLTMDKEATEQFFNEVRMSGRLQHPNIVVAIDAGEDEDVHFLAMTYVDGEPLEVKLDRERIPQADALKYISQVADALNYVWTKHELLHKDIKPGNIMIDKKGNAYLLDMGIAQYRGESKLSADGTILGSPFYMSPEQVQAEKLDWRSDLYSLGATLYHAIVGLPPFDADDIDTIVEMQIHEPLPEPKNRNPDAKVDPQVFELLKKMMEKKPENRFASWSEFLNTLKHVIDSLGKKQIKVATVVDDSQSKKKPKVATVVEKYQPKKKAKKKKKAGSKKNSKAGKFHQASTLPLQRKRRHVISQKKSNVMPMIVITIVVLFVALFIAAGVFYIRKTNRAEAAYTRAQHFYASNPEDHKEALERFTEARRVAEGTKYEIDVSRDVERIKGKIRELQKDKERFDKALKLTMYFYNDRQFQDAMKVLDQEKPFLDKDLQKQVEILKVKIRNGMEDKLTWEERTQLKTGKVPVKKKDEEAEKKEEKDKNVGEDEKEIEAKLRTDKLKNLKKGLEEKKVSVRTDILGYCREQKFSLASSVLDNSKRKSTNPDDEFKKEEDDFDAWVVELSNYVAYAKRFWESFADCGTDVAGVEFDIDKVQLGEAATIRNGILSYRGINTDNKFKKDVPIKSLSLKQLYPLMKKFRDKLKDNKEFFSYLLLSGAFTAAESYAVSESDQREIRGFRYVYLKYKLTNYYSYLDSAEADKAKGLLKKLDKKYREYPEYQKALAEVKKGKDD